MPEIFTAENLKQLPGIRHGFFTRSWGNCGFTHGDVEDVLKNRGRIAESLGIAPKRLVACHQIHSPDVITVTEPWDARNNPKADAMVTREKGIGLGILTADCVPVLLADPQAGVIGAAHAGWRGALGGIIENTVEEMERLGADSEAMVAALGPCIAQKSYEVGPEFPALFLAENPANEEFFKPAFKSDHYMFDLPGYIAAKLRALGITSIELPAADTCTDEARFFSYRRSTVTGAKREGSLISVIVLKG